MRRPGQEGGVAGKRAAHGGGGAPGRRCALCIGRRGAAHLAPVDGGPGVAQRGFGEAGHGRGFAFAREALQRQAAPQVGHRGVPGAALLAGDEAAGQAPEVVLPGRVRQRQQQGARQVGVGAGHQPPPAIAALGGQAHAGALPGESGAQDLPRLGQQARLIGHALHALQRADPVEQGAGRPLVGRHRDAGQHAGPRRAVAREGLDGGELAHVEVVARRPVLALQLAFDELRQTCQHGGAHGVGQGQRRVEPGSLGGGGQQVGGEGVAAAVGGAGGGREVVGQAVAIQVGRDLRGELGPGLVVAQGQRAAGLLLQAVVGVAAEPVGHARQPVGQTRRGRQADAAARRAVAAQGGGGRCHVEGGAAVKLHQRGLLHRERHGRQQALGDAQRVLCAGQAVARGDLPHQRLGARLRRRGRCGEVPGQLARLAGRDVHRLRLRREQRGAWRERDLHRLLGGVARGDHGAEAVALAHQRRQAADQLQVLRGGDGGLAGAEQPGAAVGHGDDAEARQAVVQRHIQAGLALGVQLHARVPQQQGVEQLARGRLAAAVAAGRHGLAAVVAPAHDLHLRGGGFHPPGASLQHGLQQLPAGVGHQLQQRLVHRGQGHLGVGGRLAVRQPGADGHAGLAAHRVAGVVGGHLDVEPVAGVVHPDLGHAEPEGGLAQIDQRGGRDEILAVAPERLPPFARAPVAPGEEAVPRHLVQAPAQGQHAHVHVGAPAGLHRQLHRRVVAAQLHHTGADNALALHRHQRGGAAERHAHLEARGLAGAVAAFLGQYVHAVVVLAAEPQLALARDPHRGGGLALACASVVGDRHQLDLARLREARGAGQQAACVALAGADGAEVLDGGVAVVGVEAAHHALAGGGGDARQRLHVQRHAGQRLAVQVERQRLQLERAVHRHPALGLDAGHHRGRPQRAAVLHGLDLAVRVGVAGLDQQLLGPRGRRQLVDHHAPRAFARQGGGQLVGHHAHGVGGRRLVFLAVALGRGLAARGVEAEAAVVREIGRDAAHRGRHAHRQAGRRPAADIADLQLHRHRGGGHQRLFGFRRDAALQHREAEFLHPEAAAFQLLAAGIVIATGVAVLGGRHAHQHPVDAQLGGARDGELAFRAAPAGGGGAPAERQGVFLPAAHMLDHQLRGKHLGQREAWATGAGLGAQQVLHRHRVAGAQQGAVEHGVGHQVGPCLAAGGHVEAPGLDALLPARPGEGHVGRAFIAGARTDKVGRAVFLVGVAAVGRLRVDALEAGDALGVGAAGRHLAALAVGHAHRRAGHRLALVEGSHPGQRVLAPELEVHRQVGHQRGGAHVHRAAGTVPGVEQRAAQHGRGQLDHVEARCERHADHLERARLVGLGGRRHLQRARAALAGQQRQHARLHHVLVVVTDGLGQRHARQQPGGVFARDEEAVEPLHAGEPADDLGISLRRQVRHRELAGLQGRLQVAQRERQQRRAVRPLGEALDDAERAAGELGQRRHRPRRHLEREAGRVGQRAAAGVLQAFGQGDAEAGALGQRGGEAQAVHQRIGAQVGVEHRRVLGLVAAQARGFQLLARHRRGEVQRHRADRHAGGLGVFALAAQLGGEGLPHLEGEALFHLVGHAAGGGHTLAKDQLHAAAGREAPVAGQGQEALRLRRHFFFRQQRLQQRGARFALDQPHGNALAHAVGHAPHAGLHALRRGRAVEAQQEGLLFLDRLAGRRAHALHERPTSMELIAACARQWLAGGRLEP